MADQRYTIHEQLGAGGNGAVFRAYDTQLKRWVAIKRLLTASEANSTDPNMEELRREADMLASLRNANIVTIFDVGSDAEGLFMVMELLEGPDLSDTIAHGPMMLDDFKQLAEQTLEALLAAHNLRILHRDIKPENIKVERLPGGRLQAKIIDFGLARTGLAARKQTEDQEGSVMGSIHYMAPEQLSREPTDVRTDLYALGCVFYEALSGRKAFDGKTVNEVIDKHLDHDLVPLHQMGPHLPQWLTYWVMRLMANKPDERPSGAQQAIEEFRAWEKLPPAPGMMPWMPMNYGYGYGAPQQYTGAVPIYQPPTSQVPVQTGGYYPHITSSSVPIATPQPVSAPVPVPASAMIPVAQVAPHMPTAGAPRAAGPSRPAGAPPGRTAVHSASAKPAGLLQNPKQLMMIGGGVLAIALIAIFTMSGGPKKGSDAAKATVPSGLKIGEAREDLYPQERSFPQPDAMRVVHLTAKVGGHGYTSSGAPSPQMDGNSLISVWEDLSKVGGNTPLATAGYEAESSPMLVTWNTPDKALKDGRSAMQFTSKSGKPVMMQLIQSEPNKGKFPFGSESAPDQAGMTLAVVLQADSSRLPARLLKLSTADSQTTVSLIITGSRAMEAQISTPQGTAKLSSQNVDFTKPSLAVLTWNRATSEMKLRTRDQRGVTHTATSKAAPPSEPLFVLEVGSADPDSTRQFTGKLAELIVLAAAQKDDQATLLDKELREYYFTPAKPGILNPTRNKALADFPVGEEREIFNGRDLTGWDGSSKYWSVKEGALTCKGDSSIQNSVSCNLVWKEGTVGDFELNLKFRAQGGVNTGIYYRAFITGFSSDGPQVNGYQFDIDSGQKQRFGGLYESGLRSELGATGQKVRVKDQSDVKKATFEAQPNAFPDASSTVAAMKASDWNEFRIVAEGNRVQHFINGKQVLDLTDEGHGRLPDGIIGFEWQTKYGSTAMFKDIRVKRLK